MKTKFLKNRESIKQINEYKAWLDEEINHTEGQIKGDFDSHIESIAVGELNALREVRNKLNEIINKQELSNASDD